MKSRMFKDSFEIIKFEKSGRNNFAHLESGDKVGCSKLGKIGIECRKCGGVSEINFRSALLSKEYICQSCIKLGENNSFYGKSHTNEMKQKHSEFMKGRYVGENNPFYGESHTEETKKIIKEKNKIYRENMTDEDKKLLFTKLSSAQRKLFESNPEEYKKNKKKAAYSSHISQFNNVGMNGIETKVFEKLVEMGLDEQFEFSVILGRMQFDFGCKEKRILLEVHGDYWHGNPKMYTSNGENNTRILNETQKEKKKRDIEKYDFAKKNGYKIYYIWESDIISENWTTIEEIANEF